MKLGKTSLLAILESVLFLIGAAFFAMVLIIPSNPIWALIAGISCGLTGAIIWSCSLFVRMGHKVRATVHKQSVNAEDVAKKILSDDNLDTDTYELHRADDYDHLDDIIPDLPEVPTTPQAE